MMKKHSVTWRANARVAREIWGQMSASSLGLLKQLTSRFALSVIEGDMLFLDGKWYVTHSGLLRIAQRRRCSGIETVIQRRMSDPHSGRWVFKATVYRGPKSRGFV